MKHPVAVFAACALAVSCSSPPREPLTEDRAMAIAQAEVMRREKWPAVVHLRDNVDERLLCQPHQNKDGSWLLVVHRAETEEDSDNSAWVPGTGRKLVIGRPGRVVSYTRMADDE